MTQAGGGGRQPISPSRTTSRGGVDLAGVQHGAVNVVRLSQEAYARLSTDSELFRHDYLIDIYHDPPVAPAFLGPDHVIGTINTPADRVMDITDLRYFVLLDVVTAGGGTFYTAVADWWARSYYAFRCSVAGKQPWEEITVDSSAIPVRRVPGGSQTNASRLTEFGDCPTHIVATPNQRVELIAMQVSAASPVVQLGTGSLLARVQGRWLSWRHYQTIVARNVME